MKYFRIIFFLMLMSVMLTGCMGKAYDEGIEYLEAGDYDNARNAFSEAIERKKNLADAYRGYAISCWEQEDYEEALNGFKHAMEEGAEATSSMYGLMGNCALKTGNYEEAIDYYAQGIVMEGTSKELIQDMEFNMIAAYEGMGDLERAREKLAAYVEKYPEDEAALKEAEFLETR